MRLRQIKTQNASLRKSFFFVFKSMAKNWWFKLDFKVWRTDSCLRRCSLETRGFWLECLCVMNETDTYEITGTLSELARLLGCESSEVMRCATELKQTKTADVTLGNGSVTLLSRRLKRELNIREQTRLRVQKLRCNADVTLQSNKQEVISKKKEEKEERKDGDAEPSPSIQLFEFWKTTMSLNGSTKLTPKRAQKITQRLKDGYTIERIQNAIRGCAMSPFHMGQNDQKTFYNDIELICRSGEKVEAFEQIFLNTPQPPKLSDEQQKMKEALIASRLMGQQHYGE